MRIRRVALALALIGGLCGTSQAEVGFGVRDSALQFDWLYGQAGDVRGTSGSDNPTRPLLSDGAGMFGGQTVQDPGYPYLGEWTASASWALGHGYSVSGTRDDVESFAVSGSTRTDATGNNCTSNLTADVNRLRLEFTVGGDAGSTTEMLLRALFTKTGNQANAIVRVDTLTPFGWSAVAIAESNATSTYMTSLFLGPGLYRIEGGATARAVAGTNPDSASASYQMSLTVAGFEEPDLLPTTIPEPGGAGLIAAVAPTMLRRVRRP